jgi:hypothetical protein
MVAWSKKAFRRFTRTSDNALIFSSGPPPIFFNVRFPENSMFTKANEADEDDVELRVLCIRLDKVATTTNILQHESKYSCLFGLRLDGFQSVLMMCEIKRVMHGSEQGLDIVVTFILFQERLPSRRI